jgi:hypothetical protein
MLAIEEYLEKASKTRSAGNDIGAHDLVFKMMIFWIWKWWGTIPDFCGMASSEDREAGDSEVWQASRGSVSP